MRRGGGGRGGGGLVYVILKSLLQQGLSELDFYGNLVVNPIIVDGYASLFNCTTVVRASDFVKLKAVGRGLTIYFWLGPPWFNYWFSFTLAYSRISLEYLSLFIIVINLIFMFSL